MLPPGLLLAIGRVESGRRDPVSGQVAPWPWTIDAAGTGQRFSDMASALAGTRDWQAKGVASIDVGCFQINLVAHRQAFTGLEQAFDPAANADYASRFLAGLKQRLGSWDSAVAAYHSSTPERGAAYRDLVMAAWGQPAAAVGMAASTMRQPPARPATVQVVSWSPTPGIRVWTPSGNAAPNVISLSHQAEMPSVRTPG